MLKGSENPHFLVAATLLASLLRTSSTQVGCANGDVRLANGFIPNEGRVEICLDNIWTVACSRGWDDADARVTCRQLGWPVEGVRVIQGTPFGSGDSSQYIVDVDCVGDEAQLIGCTHQVELDCTSDVANVICSYNGTASMYFNRQFLKNNSVINVVDVGSSFTSGIVCLTSRFPCCTSTSDGSWRYPDGSWLSVGSTLNRFYQLIYSQLQAVVLFRSPVTLKSSQGLFYCQIADRANETQYLYIGIYDSGNGAPMISSMTYDRSSQTVICTSTGGPVTSVTWSRDRTPLTVDGTTYQQSQIITDTDTATYENRLTIVQPENYGLYMCTVSNLRGNNSVELNVTVCEEGAVSVTASTGLANAFCYGGVWYDAVLRTQIAPQDDPRGGGTRVVLGSLFGITLLALIIVCVVFALCIKKKRKDHIQVPAGNSVYEPDSRMVANAVYGLTMEASMSQNLAYNSVRVEMENDTCKYERVEVHETSGNAATQEAMESMEVPASRHYSKLDCSSYCQQDQAEAGTDGGDGLVAVEEGGEYAVPFNDRDGDKYSHLKYS